jgi:hypothetical protein
MKHTMGGLAAVAAVAVLATACGSSAPSTTTASYSYAQELAIAQCIRGHGLPAFPDPSASEGFSSSVLPMIDTSKGQTTYNACKHLLTGAPSFSQLQQDLQAEQQKESEMLPALLKFEQCVRSHGEPDFSVKSGGGPGVDIGTPQFQTAERDCESVLPAGDQISFSTHRAQSGS